MLHLEIIKRTREECLWQSNKKYCHWGWQAWDRSPVYILFSMSCTWITHRSGEFPQKRASKLIWMKKGVLESEGWDYLHVTVLRTGQPAGWLEWFKSLSIWTCSRTQRTRHVSERSSPWAETQWGLGAAFLLVHEAHHGETASTNLIYSVWHAETIWVRTFCAWKKIGVADAGISSFIRDILLEFWFRESGRRLVHGQSSSRNLEERIDLFYRAGCMIRLCHFCRLTSLLEEFMHRCLSTFGENSWITGIRRTGSPTKRNWVYRGRRSRQNEKGLTEREEVKPPTL